MLASLSNEAPKFNEELPPIEIKLKMEPGGKRDDSSMFVFTSPEATDKEGNIIKMTFLGQEKIPNLFARKVDGENKF